MNLLNHLIKEKNAIGVEINTLVIRIAYFRPKKKFLKHNSDTTIDIDKELVLIEEPIPANIIANGAIVDKKLLSKVLRNIWNKENLTKCYAIISIPNDKIYTNLFPFPKTINSDHLEQAVELAIDFQLPFKKEDVYIGWESNLNAEHSNEVVISTIPKNIANDYISVLNEASINVLALESHIASISRSVNQNADEATLITFINQESVTIFILKNNTLRFSRILPAMFVHDREMLEKEITKIKNSYETEHKEKVVDLQFTNATIKDEIKKFLENTNNIDAESKWLISIGGAIRGEIKRSEDKAISLLPISTTDAYKYQKVKTFVSLMRNMTIGVSIFFLFAFMAAYLFIFSLSESTKNITANIPVSPISTDVAEKEALIQKINQLSSVSRSIISSTPNWSILIDEINSRTISGIIISSFSVTDISEKISISGKASNRDVLNKFKKNLEVSAYLDSVELPITNLEKKADIPFSITFKVKDPTMLYYK